MNETNPDYVLDSISYFFTGDVNESGTKVQEMMILSSTTDFDDRKSRLGRKSDGYIDVNGSHIIDGVIIHQPIEQNFHHDISM